MNSEPKVEILPPSNLMRPEPSEIDLLAIIEKRNALMTRILDFAIRSTHSGQWTDLGGKPWPGAAAAEVMARRCAVKISNVANAKQESRDNLGDFYIYVCSATFSLPGNFDSIEAFGTCSSRDTFLGTQTSKGRQLSEIDEGSVMKAAYSNAIVNGVARLLGVRSLSWEQLAQFGIDRAGMSAVNYSHGAQGGGQRAEGADIVLKFGKGKDLTVGAQTDDNLTWYAAAFERDLKDESKSKYHANTRKQLEAVKAEQARRAAPKADAKPSTATPWTRILALCTSEGMTPEAARPFVKGVTKKDQPSQLTEEDVAAVQDALATMKAEGGQS